MASESKFIITSKHTFNPENYLVTVEAGSKIIIEIKDKEKYDKKVLDNVEWIAQMIWKKPTFKREHLHEGLKGSKIYFNFPEPYDGGGLAWIEPVFPGEEPTNTAPNGYFINSKGLPRGIAKIEWREYQEDGLGKLIDSSEKKFGEAVQLHVYTRGLYGHNIKVKLRDYNNYDYDLNFEEAEKPEVFFKEITSEVRLFKDVTNTSAKVQKAIINIQIEPRWDYAGNYLKIGTLVTSELSKPFDSVSGDHEVYLRVRQPEPNEEMKPSPLSKSGNKPTVIENIPTDPNEYHPCKVKSISAEYFKGSSTENTDGGQDITSLKIFDEEEEIASNIINIDVVAGPRYARREIIFKVKKDAANCIYLNRDGDHNKTIVSVDAPIIIDSKIEPKKYRWDDTFVTNDLGKWFGFGSSYNKGKFEKEDLNHKDQNDNATLEDSHTTITTGEFESVLGFKREHKEAQDVTVKTYTEVIEDDSNFTVEVPYIYGSNAVNENLGDIIKCFFPLKAPKQVYPIKFKSCRGEKIVNINVYPDIKWTAQLAYNTDPDEFNLIRDKYKKYEVRKEGLKVEKDKLDMEEAVSEDLIEKYDRLSKEIKSNKGTSAEKQKKIIQKKRFKELADENREKLKKVKEKKKNRKNKKAKLKKDNLNGVVTKKNPRFYNFDSDPDSSYSDLVVSLWAEWDEYGEMFEVSGSYQKYANMVRQFLAVKDFVESIFGGTASKRGKSKGKYEKRKSAQEEATKAQELADLIEKLKGRPIFTMNIIPPSLAMAFSWYGEIPKGSPEDGLGLMAEGSIIADPIFGIEMVADFLGLLQKVPWFRPIITIMDLVDSIDVTAELSVTGKLFAKGMLQILPSGETNFNPGQLEPDAEDDSPFKIGGTVELALSAGIVFKTEYKMYGIGTLTGAFEGAAEIASGFTIEGVLEATKIDGFYMIPKMTFHGVKVKLLVEGKLSAKDNMGGEVFNKSEKIVDKEIILLDEYENVWTNEKGESLKWEIF